MAQGSFLRRVLGKCLRFFAVALFYLWIGKAIYLWLSGHHYPGHGQFARFFLAFRDGLFSLPDTVLYVLFYCAQLVSAVHHTLVVQLGYDPFAISTATSGNFGKGFSFSFGALRSLEFGGLTDQVIFGVLFVGLPLTLVQFAGLFLINATGVPIGWRYVFVPRFLNTRAHVIFGVITFGAAAWFILSAFETAFSAGVSGALAAAFLLWRPLAAGLALWLLMMFGLKPQVLLVFPLSFARFIGRMAAENVGREDQKRPNDENHHTSTGEAEYGNDRSYVPVMSNAEERLSSACSTFSVPVGEFQSPDFPRQTLVSRFRELAKRLHPDTRGSERLMAILNADYEFLLRYKGWTR